MKTDSQTVGASPALTPMTVDVVRINDAFHFAGTGASDVAVPIDGAPDIGGHNLGARPMELLLMGLAGCTAIDIILILQKQKQQIDDFRISVEGWRDKSQMPAPFQKIHLTYHLRGPLDRAKVERAIKLSMEKYCSATAQLQATAQITHSLEIEPTT